jgi:hypothetical protein
MFLFLVERVYLSRIRLSLVSGPCGYVAAICITDIITMNIIIIIIINIINFK